MDKHAVAVVALVCIAAVEVVNLVTHGPDSAVTTGIVGALTFIVGLFFRKKG